MQVRRRIHVRGIVQGVGFRPYVYRLATERHLGGQIANTSSGVIIEVEGAAEVVDDFLSSLSAQAPPLALVTEIRVVEIHRTGETDFCILPSDPSALVRTLISPDIATCADCLRELFDPADRRYHYPFINCTNCGPHCQQALGWAWKRLLRGSSYSARQRGHIGKTDIEVCGRSYGIPLTMENLGPQFVQLMKG